MGGRNGMAIHRRTFLHGAAAASALGALPASAADAPRPGERAWMAQAAAGFMQRWDVPGLAVAVARHGRIVYDEAFGVADRATGERLSPAHLFRIASLSKPVTSVAIFALIERGALRLQDRVFGKDGVLGDDYGPPPRGSRLAEITIEHLLTHTAGGWPNDSTDPMFRQPQLDQAALIAWTLASLPLARPPGAAFLYSNFGYCLLGRVVEKLSGLSYEAFVRTAVLRPAGIDMEIAGNTLAERRRAEVRYHPEGNENPYALNVRRMDAPGGWLARPSVLALFACHADGLARPALLRPPSVASMTTPSSANAGYAKGWRVNRRNTWWHAGSLAGTEAIMVRTSGGLSWAALANTRRRHTPFAAELDALVWTMVAKVPAWRS
jgi:CubicO group peptidase (beta-lactamase class C family)